MNSKQYFVILGTIFLIVSISLLFIPSSKIDVVTTITVNNKLLQTPSIESANAKLISNTIINLKTASFFDFFDIFESDDLTLTITAGRKTETKNIGTITETDIKTITLRISDISPETNKVIINLYEDGNLRDTKEITINNGSE